MIAPLCSPVFLLWTTLRLSDDEPPTWRYRIGAFRVFYSVDADTSVVFLLTVDDRKDAYR